MIGEGNLTYRFDTGSRNDELESLASTFNQIAISILHREKQFEEINEALRTKNKEEKAVADLIARSEKQYRDLVETANSKIKMTVPDEIFREQSKQHAAKQQSNLEYGSKAGLESHEAAKELRLMLIDDYH
ncbi:HAMP domain-containing protein [uncultured Desulfobacter sp.]|uniref:HAMP domain-containing protein n=1 Tax=uncultured Desulfobacter sp. TaxID=240139 RepID=UPI0029F4D701|nr:HAMP domain-containing protein [uncultured Desulfobacter sp.]